MKRFIIALAALLMSASLSYAQNTTKLCISTNGSNCIPVTSSNPLPTTAAGAGTGNVNLTQILGNPPSLTNPLFVAPSTSAVFNIGTVTPGTAAANLGKAEDAVANSGDTGVFALGVRRDALAASSADGDYTGFTTDIYGSIQTRNFEKQAASYTATALISPAATAQDIAIINGNATTTVYVTKVIVSGTQTTGGNSTFFLGKRSTANSGGTSVAVTSAKMDSASGNTTTVVLQYTTNPTAGNNAGIVAAAAVPIPAPASPATSRTEFQFGGISKPIVLRGVAEGVAVNLNGVTLTGGSILVTFEWYEL